MTLERGLEISFETANSLNQLTDAEAENFLKLLLGSNGYYSGRRCKASSKVPEIEQIISLGADQNILLGLHDMVSLLCGNGQMAFNPEITKHLGLQNTRIIGYLYVGTSMGEKPLQT